MAKTEINNEGYRVFSDSKKLVHIWAAEKKYSKEQINGKHVHHLDGDKLNNEPSNLILLTKEDHYAVHAHQRKIDFMIDLIIGGGIGYSVCLLLVFLGVINDLTGLTIAGIMVVMMFIFAFELRTGIIKKVILRPHQKILNNY